MQETTSRDGFQIAISVIKEKFEKQCIVERASHEQELKMTLKKLSERQLQIQQCNVQKVQSSVTSSGDETSSGIVSDEVAYRDLEAAFEYPGNHLEDVKVRKSG
ncbi:hypothetical protein Tco_0700297 [Tanacetum coccineum]